MHDRTTPVLAVLGLGLWLAACAGGRESIEEPNWASCFKLPSAQTMLEQMYCERATQPE